MSSNGNQANPNALALKEINAHLHAPGTKAMLRDSIPASLAHRVSPESIASNVYRVCLQAMATAKPGKPGLLDCTPSSIINAAAEGAAVGLVPGRGITAEGYIIPYKGQATWVTSYRGLIVLAVRSGEIKTVKAGIVYENDAIMYRDLERGEQPDWGAVYVEETGFERPRHYINPRGERGERLWAYSCARMSNGEVTSTYMTIPEVCAIRDGAPHKGKSEPWVLHFDEMAKKTTTRRAAKTWPLSVEDLQRVLRDAEAEAPEDRHLVVDGGTLGTTANVAAAEAQTSTKRVLAQLQAGTEQPPPHKPETGEVLEPSAAELEAAEIAAAEAAAAAQAAG